VSVDAEHLVVESTTAIRSVVRSSRTGEFRIANWCKWREAPNIKSVMMRPAGSSMTYPISAACSTSTRAPQKSPNRERKMFKLYSWGLAYACPYPLLVRSSISCEFSMKGPCDRRTNVPEYCWGGRATDCWSRLIAHPLTHLCPPLLSARRRLRMHVPWRWRACRWETWSKD